MRHQRRRIEKPVCRRFRNSGMRRFASLAVTIAFAIGCSADKSGRFSLALARKLESDHPSQIDLSTIDGPVWDELFIFPPRSTRDENCKILNLGWLECRTTMPATVAEGEDFIVFLTKKRISSAQQHSQRNGEFVIENGKSLGPVARNSAVFSVRREASSADGSHRVQLVAHSPPMAGS